MAPSGLYAGLCHAFLVFILFCMCEQPSVIKRDGRQAVGQNDRPCLALCKRPVQYNKFDGQVWPLLNELITHLLHKRDLDGWAPTSSVHTIP